MSKNTSITNFFKPVPRVSQSPQSTPTQTQTATSTQTPASPTPPPLVPHVSFSPTPAPPPPPSAARDRNQVIWGSDDEDDDDLDTDDEFPDLFALPSTLPVQPLAARKELGLLGTPRAKRPAVLDLNSSPLTINTRHKFDIQALLKHAEADSANEKSQKRTAELLAQGSPTTVSTGPGATEAPADGSLHDDMLAMLPGSGDDHGGKLLRAVKRTEANVEKRVWYFFDRQPDANEAAVHVRKTFPKSKATGVWSMLASEKNRLEVFEDGLPYNVECRMRNLPDEIFEWVLHEAPWEKSRRLRDEYVRLLGACSHQIGRVLNESAVLGMFRDLGASVRALETTAFPPATSGPSGAESEQGAPYPEQARVRLETVLRILGATAHGANLQVLTRTTSILLRLGIDHIVREDQAIGTAYQDALLRFVSAVSFRAWNSFCGDVSDSLYNHTQSSTLRWNAVSSIPILHARLAELRRRLALVFVFDDPRRGYSPAAETFSIRSVIDRLEHADEFVIDRNTTDFPELLSLCELLIVAVGDGNPPSFDDYDVSPEAIRQYNAEVDELARKIKHMWSNIHEQGAAYISRLEARSHLKDFERKLHHVIRTRPRPKEDIFGINPTEEELDRPRQQQFMRRFLGKKEASLPTTPVTPMRAGGNG
ncbi:hypothetical protein VTJ49DRAFT_288 [Mycothermus thermophilus]|uniref:Exocyst complex component EXO84 n=1 Tax=Humicola insolens TaxID=85995 RepID=A0ABR3VHL7_HUMIN